MALPKEPVRAALALVVVCSALTLVVGYADAQRTSDRIAGDPRVEDALRTGDRSPVVASRNATTVVATDSNAVVSDDGSAPRAQAELVAFGPDGRIYYYGNEHTRYWDVDPVDGTSATVEFVYADHLDSADCDGAVCTESGVERVNLTTGERTAVFSRITPGEHSTRWHDVDRIDNRRLLVADIARDRVFVVDAPTGRVVWEWDAQSTFDVASGGPYPDDWTHLNDVEYVEVDGREAVMVSLRNQDQVVFIGLDGRLLEEWTLGADDDHDVLYEQHNPDFVPAERGGPALLVADSENRRVVEYGRDDGEWVRTWTWTDARLQWPRDADRLPNGHTLVTDSNGDRVIELDREGDVVWTAPMGFPYEAERLGTGDESAGGESARALGLSDRHAAPGDDSTLGRVLSALPPAVRNGVWYLLPRWVGGGEVLALLALLVGGLAWAVLEYRWSERTVELRSPLRVMRR